MTDLQHGHVELDSTRFSDKWKGEEEITLWIGAFRYYLKLKTNTTKAFCDLLVAEWDSLSDETRGLIQNSLEMCYREDFCQRCRELLEMQMDRVKWKEVLDYIRNQRLHQDN